MRLEKYHALGNDFLVLLDLDGRQPVDDATARALCDRHRGIGADGLIRATAGGAGADVTMELRNADGGRAETSGNGLRCLALAVVDAGIVPGPEVTVATDAGVRRAVLQGGGLVSVEMGVASTDGQVGTPRRGARVDLGNPHVVIEVDHPAGLDLAEEAAAFPGTNVELVTPGPGDGELTMRIWERGVGETLSCGSGACAGAVAARGWDLVGPRVTVHQPGGDLTVDIGDDGALTLTGPAEHVGAAEIRPIGAEANGAPWR
jgi:diaminopimelate epimerase